MSTVDEVILAIEALPKADQRRVLERLSAALEPGSEDSAAVADAWRAEIERRSDEIDAGTARLIPGEEVRAKARTLLGMPMDD
jgi:putative addiction module component (TIGR02574 family)